MLRDEVLALLKAWEGKPLSGEEMSRALGVSRAAVWKAMESLRDEGYVISSAPRRGYALEGSPDRLSAGELAGALAGRRVGRALVCLETVDSTNNEVKRRALAGAADGLAVGPVQQCHAVQVYGAQFHDNGEQILNRIAVITNGKQPLIKIVHDSSVLMAQHHGMVRISCHSSHAEKNQGFKGTYILVLCPEPVHVKIFCPAAICRTGAAHGGQGMF